MKGNVCFFKLLINENVSLVKQLEASTQVALLSTWGCLGPGGGLRADQCFCSGEWVFVRPPSDS